jgi:hypothetical protein
MPVDVLTETTIARPRAEVAAYACDPDNATRWYENIKSVEWRSPRPLSVGTRLAFVASFLGRRLEYTYEVRELVPGERFVIHIVIGCNGAPARRPRDRRRGRVRSRVCRPIEANGKRRSGSVGS